MFMSVCSRADTPAAVPKLSTAQISEHYSTCIKLSTENVSGSVRNKRGLSTLSLSIMVVCVSEIHLRMLLLLFPSLWWRWKTYLKYTKDETKMV